MSFLYFAYGSNMLAARLAHRCASATLVGAASVAGHRLSFDKVGVDGSGKATLHKLGDKLARVPGVLFEITLPDRDHLDRAESAGVGYDRVDNFCVTLRSSGEAVTATSYIASQTQAGLRPYDWYLALIVAGARQHDLARHHVDRLAGSEFVIDHDEDRDARKLALHVLRSSGHHDHHRLLGG